MANDANLILVEFGGTAKVLLFDLLNDGQLTLEQFGVTVIVVVSAEGFVCS